MTLKRFFTIPIVVLALVLAGVGVVTQAAADGAGDRKLAGGSTVGPFIDANIGPFIVKHQGTHAAWVMNTNTGSIRLCQTLRSRASPQLSCSGWSDPGVVGSGTVPTFATASIDCGDKLFTLSTGTATGNCSTELGSDGLPAGGECNDGMNSAAVSCVARTGSCTSSGAGSCVASASFSALDMGSEKISTVPVQ